jgi:hypothetical protein
MSSTNLEIVFEGSGVRQGTINARLLADALIGCSDVFTRANQIVNGEASEAVVLVQSDFKRGSFVVDVQLVQGVVEHAKHLITSHPFLSSSSLASIIGFVSRNKNSLIDLYKWLKGKKPDKIASVKDNNYEVTFGQNKKTVSGPVINMYGDSAIQIAMEKLTSPLRQGDAIDRIAVKQDGKEQSAIEREEAQYFEKEPLLLESDETPTEGERDTVLVVSKLSFTEGTTWNFFERGAVVIAKIQDEKFWSDVHQHRLTFGEGDMLRVRLYWKIEKKRKLIQKNTITKVYELIERRRPKQLRLPGTAESKE